MLKKLILISFVIVGTACNFFAQEQNESNQIDNSQNLVAQNDNTQQTKKLIITVEEAVEQALKNNKSLKSSAIDLEMKKRAAQYGWNTLLPSIGVNITAARTNQSPYDSVVANFKIPSAVAALSGQPVSPESMASAAGYDDNEKINWSVVGPSISVSWAFNLAMIDQIRLAKAQYENGEISWEKTEKTTINNIRKMFYGLLLAQEDLNIHKEKLANARERYNQAAINYRNGLVPEMSMLNTQVNFENQKPTVLSKEQSLKQNKDTFAFLLGLPVGTEIELEGEIYAEPIKVDKQELVKKALDSNDDVRALKKNIELAKIGIHATQMSTFTPSLAINWGFSPYPIKAGIEADDLLETDSGTLSFTIAYQNVLNMLPCSANIQKLKDLKSQLAQAELGLEQLTQSTEIEINTLIDNLAKCQANIKAMSQNVELSKKAYNSTLRAYNNGTQEWLSVQESENQMNQAHLGMMNERYNYISALLDLENKTNMKFVK